MKNISVVLCGTVIAAVGACMTTEPATHTAQVHFVLDAPLCSSTIPVSFSIDGAVVGVDTFRVHYPPNHTESRTFSVTLGAHVLGARTFGAFSYAWRDTVVIASSRAITTDSLPFYCS